MAYEDTASRCNWRRHYLAELDVIDGGFLIVGVEWDASALRDGWGLNGKHGESLKSWRQREGRGMKVVSGRQVRCREHLYSQIDKRPVPDFKGESSLPTSRMEPGGDGTGTGLCQWGNNLSFVEQTLDGARHRVAIGVPRGCRNRNAGHEAGKVV